MSSDNRLPEPAASLNRFFRAVNDRVCPACGDEFEWDEQVAEDANSTGYRCVSGDCGLYVTDDEMTELRKTMADWGRGPVHTFLNWRRQREEKKDG